MKIRQTATLALLSGLFILLLQGFMHDLPVGAQGGGATARVSLSPAGEQGNGHSVVATLSADGRYVVFNSLASNLVPSDTNGRSDIFIRDRITSQTTRVSVSSGGEAGNGDSHWPAISADGRFVGFLSSASNLVSGDTNGVADIFVHDRSTGVTSRISISSDGEQAN